MSIAVTAATLAAMPSMLLGGLALLVRQELHFGAFELGIAVATFFAVSGVVSIPAGMLSEVVGPRTGLLAGALTTAGALVGAGLLSSSWTVLLLWMGIGGVGNTVTQVATNHLLAARVPPGRQGLAFGLKQSAIPMASMIAGLALPILGLSVGWRSTYLLVAAAAAPVYLLVRRLPPPRQREPRATRAGDAPIRILLFLSLGLGLGTAAGSSLTAFTVAAAADSGIAAPTAGLLLTVGSLAGVTTRIASGWIADRMGRGSLLLASRLIAVGVLGYVGLALNGPAPLIFIATIVAFAGGWGFPGLVLLAVARTNRRAPATAMGVVRLGPAAGAIVGPLAFGALADGPGYSAAWLVAAVSAVAAATLLRTVRQTLRPYGNFGSPG